MSTLADYSLTDNDILLQNIIKNVSNFDNLSLSLFYAMLTVDDVKP